MTVLAGKIISLVLALRVSLDIRFQATHYVIAQYMVSAVQHKHEGLEYFMHHANIYAYLVAREALFTNVKIL